MNKAKREKTAISKRPSAADQPDASPPKGTPGAGTLDELVDAICLSTNRRVATLIQLHPRFARESSAPAWTMDTHSPAAAVHGERERAAVSADRNAGGGPSERTTALLRQETDRQAVERGENEGMIALAE